MRVLVDTEFNIVYVFIIIAALFLAVAIFIILYIFVFSRNSSKRQIRDLHRKFSYLDALLIGQDSQYIHRLEIISRTNLLYVEKYNEFSKRFKTIYENDDKFADSMLKQLNALIANRQYKNIKGVINDAKHAISAFENSVNKLDSDLYSVIRPEEEARQTILKLKEDYRRVKQIFYSNSNDLEMVAISFTKIFDKLDQSFTDFESHIESAEYDEANAIIPVITQVISALDNALQNLPNLCILVKTVVPEKMDNLTSTYNEIEKRGVPLFNLSYRHKVDRWQSRLKGVQKKLISLQTGGVLSEVNDIQNEMEEIRVKLQQELDDKEFFETNSDSLYRRAIALEKTFLHIVALMPEVNKIYVVVPDQQNKLEVLKANMNRLSTSKQNLDSFVHSGTKQPYSVLKKKLEELQEIYDLSFAGANEFKIYIDSLKSSCEEAYSLIFIYFRKLKEIEGLLKVVDVPSFTEQYASVINESYEILNELDQLLKVQPIDVNSVNEKVEELKHLANPVLDEVEERYNQAQLAESAVVYNNRDRNHQSDVHQQLSVLEKTFFSGDFEKVYRDASAIFKRNHVEDTFGNE